MSQAASTSRKVQASTTAGLKSAGAASPSPSNTNNLDIYRPIAKNVKVSHALATFASNQS